MKITKRNSSFTLHKNLEYINNKKELKTECSIQNFSKIKDAGKTTGAEYIKSVVIKPIANPTNPNDYSTTTLKILLSFSFPTKQK